RAPGTVEHGLQRVLLHRPAETGGGDHRFRAPGGAWIDGANGVVPSGVGAEPERRACVVEAEGGLLGLHRVPPPVQAARGSGGRPMVMRGSGSWKLARPT